MNRTGITTGKSKRVGKGFVWAALFALSALLFHVPGHLGGQIAPAKSRSVAGSAKIDEIMKPFSIGDKGRASVDFEVQGPGRIEARAEWTGAAETLSLILNGPGQSGYYARQNGKSPLSLSFKVTDDHLSRGKKWTLSVANFGTGSARGKVVIKVPAAAEPAAQSAEAETASGKTAVKQTVQRPTRQSGVTQSVEKSIKVLWPNGGEELIIGKTYTFRWESKGVSTIDVTLEGERLNPRALPAADGRAELRVPRVLRPGTTVIEVRGRNISDQSDGQIKLIQPPVDLECRIVRDQDYTGDWRIERRYIVKVRNNGTRVLKDVVVNWVLTRIDTVVKQDGWGFGEMFPGKWYENNIAFKRQRSSDHWKNYQLALYVDPHNQQNEDEELRDDNLIRISGTGSIW